MIEACRNADLFQDEKSRSADEQSSDLTVRFHGIFCLARAKLALSPSDRVDYLFRRFLTRTSLTLIVLKVGVR
jgi:hypothetical protein